MKNTEDLRKAGWIICDERLPEEIARGAGRSSRDVRVILNTGEEDIDFLINGRWVWHCKLDSTGGYPVAWRDIDGERI